ncbi:MAG TPA: hypothetical protein VFT16_04115 [Candidatus Saccharimonadales bacterium]|nr:hypothetical protein [Candidatus Saccharimonadales bacterium]
MLGFTGTFRLIRLALRRDRIKLPVWILVLSIAMAVNVPAVTEFYGKTVEQQVSYAANMAPSLAGRIFGGPISDANVGAIVINETFLFSAVAVIFMSILCVVRHTRQNEETGRSELIGSAVVGRNASLGAALIVTIGANIIFSVLCALALIAADLPVDGSVGTAAALGGLGIMFAGIAAVTAQISDSARGANSMAAIALGLVFLLRALGDSLGDLKESGLGVISAWPSWFSPIGWAQQVHPYTEQNWWLFGLMTAFFAACLAVAFYFNDRRDLGLGMISARKGPANAPKALLSVQGLANRLQKGVFRGWLAGAVIGGLMIGLIAKEFSKLFAENDAAREYLESVGGGTSFEDIYFSAMLGLMGIVFAGYAIQALQRVRAEEANGQLEPVLATHTSKPRWMLSHIVFVIAGCALMLATLGVSTGLMYWIVADGVAASEIWRITWAALAQFPAILVIMGVIIAAFGLLPRMTVAIGWSAFGICIFISQFAAFLELPQYVLNISPFTHLPSVPAEPLTYLPLTILAGVGIGLLLTGIIAFRRRDITTA